jgi:CubicO group peptidase (beta-lactamase class C family)
MSRDVLPILAALCFPLAAVAQRIPTGAAIDAEVGKIMTRTQAKGMAVAVIDRGMAGYVRAFGVRNAKGTR